jgi:hypothetical protein
MLRLLYFLFRKRFNSFYFNHQSKAVGFENLEKAFVDSNGNAYYKYSSDFDIPISRFKEIQKRLVLLNSGLSGESITLLCSAMEKALNNGKKPDIAEIGFLIKEIGKRANIFVDTDLLMDTACLLYIRQDEKQNTIDWGIHKQKVEQLTIDSKGGLYDFFYLTGLTAYIPFLGTSDEEFNLFYNESELKMKSLKMHLESYTTEPS